eukprot:m51a1_g12176 hypothetical protein (140) ;mRNA; r:4092-4578
MSCSRGSVPHPPSPHRLKEDRGPQLERQRQGQHSEGDGDQENQANSVSASVGTGSEWRITSLSHQAHEVLGVVTLGGRGLARVSVEGGAFYSDSGKGCCFVGQPGAKIAVRRLGLPGSTVVLHPKDRIQMSPDQYIYIQ